MIFEMEMTEGVLANQIVGLSLRVDLSAGMHMQ